MRWEDERYVRVYTRDTVDWQFLSFEAQGLLTLILRKVDRAGILELGRHDRAKAVAMAIGHPTRWETIGPALDELLADGCIVINDSTLIFRNYIEAQEATASDKARQQKARETARDIAKSRNVTAPSQNVTKQAENVTSGHVASRPVTPSRAVPSVPCRAEPTTPAEAVSVGSFDDEIRRVFRDVRGHEYEPPVTDLAASRTLLGKFEQTEILRRARIAFGKKYPACSDLATLLRNWNAYATADPPAPNEKPKDVRRGRVAAEDVNWAGQKPEVSNVFE